MNVQAALQSQYLAALSMLSEAIEKCPQAAWNAPRDRDKTWFRAYHAVYYAHKYLLPTSKDFLPWHGHNSTNSGAAISKEELLAYIGFVTGQIPEQLRLADLTASSGFSSYPAADRLEMHLINIRHVQQHAGELYERLGVRANVKLRWAGYIHRNVK